MKRRFVVLIACALSPILVRPAVAQEPTAGGLQNPLAPFERLIGGEWHLGESFQEFEWGVGKRSVRSRAYFLEDGVPRLVSEGIWFWHPGERAIRGVFTAVNMPVVFFDYTTRFQGDQMISDLRSFDAAGNETVYVESFDLSQDDRYEWALKADGPEGLREVMGGTYTRRRSR